MLIYFYGDAAMNAVTWLLDHEIIMAVVLIAILGIAYWWLTSKKLQQTEIA